MNTPTGDVAVLIVDDHEIVREGLAARIGALDGFYVAGTAGSATEAVSTYEDLAPHLVVVDHSLPDGDGLSVLTRVRHINPAAVVVMLSAYDDPALIARYVNQGVSGYAHKSVPRHELAAVLRTAHAGERALDSVGTDRLMKHVAAPGRPEPTSPLSPREKQVLDLVGAGYTNDAVARELFISPQTVKTHLSRIYGKLGVPNRAAAVSAAG